MRESEKVMETSILLKHLNPFRGRKSFLTQTDDRMPGSRPGSKRYQTVKR